MSSNSFHEIIPSGKETVASNARISNDCLMSFGKIVNVAQ
jgi:hypothetical protein